MATTKTAQPTEQQEVTFKHLTAGSVVHYQEPKASKDDSPNPVETITFHGKRGGPGFYSTRDPKKIEMLMKIAINPQTQLEVVEAPLADVLSSPEAEVVHKPLDPAITQAATEVQQRAEVAVSPAVVALQAKLGATIAAANGGAAA